MPPKKKFKDFETAAQRLEEITDLLESGEISLEDSIDLYAEGLDISRECLKKLDAVEKKIKIISQKNDKPVEVDFDNLELDN